MRGARVQRVSVARCSTGCGCWSNRVRLDTRVGIILFEKFQTRTVDALSLEFGRALWEREETLADPSTLASSAARAGLDVAELRAGPSDTELDALCEQFTHEALAAGVFGAPSYVSPSGEIFWGQDRLDLLERALKKAG